MILRRYASRLTVCETVSRHRLAKSSLGGLPARLWRLRPLHLAAQVSGIPSAGALLPYTWCFGKEKHYIILIHRTLFCDVYSVQKSEAGCRPGALAAARHEGS